LAEKNEGLSVVAYHCMTLNNFIQCII